MLRSVAVAAVTVAMVAPAQGIVLSEDPLEETSTAAGLVLRNFSFLSFGEVLDPVGMDPSGVGLLDLRLYFARRAASYKLVVHNQLTMTVRSHAPIGGLAVGRGVVPPRWLPLRAELADEATLGVVNEVDWLYLAYDHGPVTITIGRQPITFGRGKLWSPTDLVGTFSLTEVDTEYKPGADAVRLDWTVAEMTQVTAIAATGELVQDDDLDASLSGSSFVLYGKRGWQRLDVGLLAGLVRGDGVVGVDAMVDAGNFELHGEAAATWVSSRSLQSPQAADGDVVPKAVFGATFRPNSKWMISPELMVNGFGTLDAADYGLVAQSQRVAVGEQPFVGTLHASAVTSWELHPLITLSGVLIVNPRDPSGLVSLAARYSVSDNVEAMVGGYAPAGKSPEGLTPRSEYGMYPYFLFAELKAVL